MEGDSDRLGALADDLAALDISELVEVLRRSFEKRRLEEESFVQKRLFLGQVYHVQDPQVPDNEWELQSVAYPTDSAFHSPRIPSTACSSPARAPDAVMTWSRSPSPHGARSATPVAH